MLTKVQLSVLIDSIVKALVAFNKQKALLGPSLGTVKASRRFVSSSTSEHPTCGYSRLPSAAMSSCSGCCPSGILDYTQPWPHIGGLISHQHLQQPSRTGARGFSCSQGHRRSSTLCFTMRTLFLSTKLAFSFHSFPTNFQLLSKNGFVKRANFEWQVSSDHIRGWPMDIPSYGDCNKAPGSGGVLTSTRHPSHCLASMAGLLGLAVV